MLSRQADCNKQSPAAIFTLMWSGRAKVRLDKNARHSSKKKKHKI